MRLIQNGSRPKVLVVGCLHGNELIGERVFQYYESRLAEHPGLSVLLANVEAMQKNVRFIDDDLNRSFPGSAHGHHEEQLAHQLMPLVTAAEYVLDLHTTSCGIRMVPIVASLDAGVRRVINLTSSPEVALMERDIPSHALIGQVPTGVSLEFNEDYARTEEAVRDVSKVVEGLLADARVAALERRIYHVTGTIPPRATVPRAARDFELIPELNLYPVLLHERSYTTHQGFAATRVTSLTI